MFALEETEGTSSMLDTYTFLEILLIAACAFITIHELLGIARARRLGFSKNVSRIATHVTILVLLVPYAYFVTSYLPLEASTGALAFGTPVLNMTYVLIWVMISILAAWESFSMVHARYQKKTSNVSRLVSHTVLLLMMLVMLGLSSQKWNRYLDRLDASYAQDIPEEVWTEPGG